MFDAKAGVCHRGVFDGLPCQSSSECVSLDCRFGVCGGGLKRRLAITGSLDLPQSGISFELWDTKSAGFRMVSNVAGIPALMDTGSSSLIFCNGNPLASGQYSGPYGYGCDNYGQKPTPTNLPTLYGAASDNFLQTSGTFSLPSLGPTTFQLSSSYYKVVVTASPSVTFCVDGLGAIFGMAGDFLNDADTTYDVFPQCTVNTSLVAKYYPSAFPYLVTKNDNFFGIYLDYEDRTGEFILGAPAHTMTTLQYSVYECNQTGNPTNYTFASVGTFALTGFNPSYGDPTPSTGFGFYQAAVTSCGYRGSTQLSFSSTPMVFDTGTEGMVFPKALYDQLKSIFPLNSQGNLGGLTGFVDCYMPTSGSGSVVLSLDLSIAKVVGTDQGIYYVESDSGSGEFIVGVPFWAQYYTLIDLFASTITVYTPPPKGTCFAPTLSTQSPSSGATQPPNAISISDIPVSAIAGGAGALAAILALSLAVFWHQSRQRRLAMGQPSRVPRNGGGGRGHPSAYASASPAYVQSAPPPLPPKPVSLRATDRGIVDAEIVNLPDEHVVNNLLSMGPFTREQVVVALLQAKNEPNLAWELLQRNL